jgi:hypothetical protein
MWFSIDKWSAAEWGIWASFLAQSGLIGTIIVGIRQLQADHLRSRRERTLELMKFWSEQTVTYASELFAVRHIICHLEKRQCEELWHSEELRIDVRHKLYIARALKMKDGDLTIEGSDVVLKPELTLRLREITAFLLNLLEVVFFAWRNNVAEREMIADEFGALLAPPNGGYPLEEMACATGIYPSIRQFIYERQRQDRSQQFGKPIAS